MNEITDRPKEEKKPSLADALLDILSNRVEEQVKDAQKALDEMTGEERSKVIQHAKMDDDFRVASLSLLNLARDRGVVTGEEFDALEHKIGMQGESSANGWPSHTTPAERLGAMLALRSIRDAVEFSQVRAIPITEDIARKLLDGNFPNQKKDEDDKRPGYL